MAAHDTDCARCGYSILLCQCGYADGDTARLRQERQSQGTGAPAGGEGIIERRERVPYLKARIRTLENTVRYLGGAWSTTCAMRGTRRRADCDARMRRAIMVWLFHEAPPEFQALSPHGGDEDWLALIPASIAGEPRGVPDWCYAPSAFGVCDTSKHRLPNGDIIAIGAHS